MSVRERVLLGAGVFLLPALFAPLLTRPVYAIGFVCAAAGLWLAFRGVEYPLTLTAVFAILIALLGHNPFPHGVISKLSFLWIAAALIMLVLREPGSLPLRVLMAGPVVLTLATAGWMLARLGASAAPAYGSTKLQLFVITNLVFLIAGIAVAQRRASFRTVLLLTLALGAVSAILLARNLGTGHAHAVIGGRFSISSDFDPIIFGRDAARAITVAVFFLLVSRSSGLRLASLASIPVLAVAFTAAGSRGPALGLVLGLMVLFGMSLREREARKRLLFVVSGGIVGAYLVSQLVPGQNVSRSLSFLTGNSHDASSNGRTALWKIAWRTFSSHPLFGVGTGGYHAVDPGNLYPHNLFLETLAELGIVGGLLVAGTIVFGLTRLRTAWVNGTPVDREDTAMVASLIVAAFANAMFSGDVTTNNALWLSIGLAVGLSRRVSPDSGTFHRLMRRRTEKAVTSGAVGPPQARGSRIVAPRILTPGDGDHVEGVVQVEVAAPRTGCPLALLQLVWEVDGVSRLVAERDERTFDVQSAHGAAIVRSQTLAESIAAALGTQPRPSRRHPWAAPPSYTLEWDTHDLASADGTLRAVAIDEQRRETPSDGVELTLVSARASLAPEREPVVDVRDVPELVEEPPAPAGTIRITAPSAIVRGVVEIAVEAVDVSQPVRLEVAVEDSWELQPAGASLDTKRFPDGALRVRGVAGDVESQPIVLMVDNEPPVVRIAAPHDGAEVHGVVVPLVEADDAASGVQSTLLQRSADGVTWRPLVDGRWDTTQEDEGTWRLRATAVDRAHNVGRSEIVTVSVSNPVPEPEPEPQPEPQPEPEPAPPAPEEPVAPPAREPGRRPTLDDLEALAATQTDPYRREELTAIVFYLRDFAQIDGSLPEQFDDLIAMEFGA